MAENGGSCANCGHLQAQVYQLQQQVAQLRQENQQLRRRIQRLQRVLQMARSACRQYMVQTGEVLSQRSGVPRARWAYCKGGYTVAARLWAMLGGET